MSERAVRVLLVDDERELVDYLAKRLTKRGFDVEGAYNGEDAVGLARQRLFDVAVIDLKMPEMDGIEVLKAVKDIQPFLQVVMLTGHGSMDSALESGRADALFFLVKPYEFDKLMEVIYQAADNRKVELKTAFDEEINELIGSSRTPHEIMTETKRLRAAYEQ